jgi:hypothetical protein
MRSRIVALDSQRIHRSFLLALAVVLALSLSLIAALPAHAQTAKVVHLNGVQTTLTTDSATTNLLFGAGIIPLPVWPTPVVPTTTTAQYTFPVTAGHINPANLFGTIVHSGGIVLAHKTTTGWQALSLTKFAISISAHPSLSAIVNGKSRATIATLDLGMAKIVRYASHGWSYVRISNVGVSLNQTAVDAINATFGTDLSAPVKLGTAAVLVRVAR